MFKSKLILQTKKRFINVDDFDQVLILLNSAITQI